MDSTKDKEFDNLMRLEKTQASSKIIFDLIIIGGGITGAGIAFDASQRGLKTLLVEKRDFASGTSSKSTKLIHGGLRYLKQFEIGLVRESGLERAVVHNNIPHLVHPETMILPIVNGGEFNKFTASAAIFIYDWLAKVPSKDRKISYSKDKVLEIEPHLNPTLLKSAIAYSEYRTDDARLTIELIKAARRQGAEAFNYMKVEHFLYNDGKVVGVTCEDRILEKEVHFKAKHIVSAAGPWVDTLREENKSKKGKRLHLTKGVHIVISNEDLPLNNSVYFDAFDGRMIFAIPRGKVSYVGTSDTNYNKDLDRVLCTIEDVDYLLSKVNTMFPNLNLSKKHVISSWAGLRPLIHEDGKSPSELSRKDEIFVSDTGLISIAGGKLTGYRKMSKKIVDLLIKKDPSLPKVSCATKKAQIHSDSFNNYSQYEQYQTDLKSRFNGLNISDYNIWYLSSTYGKNASYIIEKALNYKDLDFDQALLRAEIQFCNQYESTFMPDDFFNRRSGRLYFDIQSVTDNLDFIVEEFRVFHQWTNEKTDAIRSRCRQLIRDVSEFRSEVLIN